MTVAHLSVVEDDGGNFADELPPGTQLLYGQYTISRFLNAGGFGITYLAKDSLDRSIVIKECFPAAFCRRVKTEVQARSRSHQDELSSIVRLFVEEARALAKLVHPNIVGVHQVFEENNTAYMSLDFVEGRDLLEMLEDKAWAADPAQITTVLRKILDATGFVHAEGMLHRDISPDNILVEPDGNPILIDFGAAREQASKQSRVLSALRVVKDGYSPQEFYISGAEQGPWSDLYALGATFYHVLTRELPPDSQSRLGAVAGQSEDPYVSLVGRVKGYDRNVLTSIDKALALMPRDRVQSAQDWLDLLDRKRNAVSRAVSRTVSSTSRADAAGRAPAAHRKSSKMGVLLGSAAVLAVVAGIAATQMQRGGTDEAGIGASDLASGAVVSPLLSRAPGATAEPAPGDGEAGNVLSAAVPAPDPDQSLRPRARPDDLGQVPPVAVPRRDPVRELPASGDGTATETIQPQAQEALRIPDALDGAVAPRQSDPVAALAPLAQDETAALARRVAVPALPGGPPARLQEALARVDTSEVIETAPPPRDALIPSAVTRAETAVSSAVRPRARPANLGEAQAVAGIVPGVPAGVAAAADLARLAASDVAPAPAAPRNGSLAEAPRAPESPRLDEATLGAGFVAAAPSAPALVPARDDGNSAMAGVVSQSAVAGTLPETATFSRTLRDLSFPVGVDQALASVPPLALPRSETAQGADSPPETDALVGEEVILDQPEPQAETILAAAPTPTEPSQIPATSGISSAALTSEWSVELPFALDSDVPVTSINGIQIAALSEIEPVLRQTVTVTNETEIPVAFSVRDPATGSEQRQVVVLPIVQRTALTNGMAFESRFDGGAWKTTLVSLPEDSGTELKPGDQLVTHLSSDRRIDGRSTLETIILDELAQGTRNFSFAVQRNGQLWVSGFTYAPAEVAN